MLIIINLIYIAQFDTNAQTQYMHIKTYTTQSYSYTYTYLHIYTYTNTCTNMYRHVNKVAPTHITSFPKLVHLHVCTGIYAQA